MAEKTLTADSVAKSILEKNNFFSAQIYGSTQGTDGSVSTEDTTTGDISMDDTLLVKDRSVKIKITRDDDGCEWAYDNDVFVKNNVDRIDSIMNNGFIVNINQEYIKDDKPTQKAKGAKKLIENKVMTTSLQEKLSVMIKNRAIYGFGVGKKRFNEKDIIGLVEIDSKECTPIRNLSTGELGGSIGKGLNGKEPNMEVAMIQYGNIPTYTAQGEVTYLQDYFYFSDDEIFYITNNDRGKFKGTSPVMRVLRLVEIKKTMENAVELVTKRFGPQMWIIVGNEVNNLSTADIPKSYLEDEDGNPIDKSIARQAFKTEVFSAIDTQIKRWIEGDSLVQLAEFGVDVKTINPSSSSFDYAKYIELFADFIKIGILGLDMPGRVDVTSGIMQTNLTRDLRDYLIRDRGIIINMLNQRFTNIILEANGYDKDIVHLDFKPLDLNDEAQRVDIELKKSQAVYNYMKGGWTDLPEYLKKDWNMNLDGKVMSMDDMKKKLKEEPSNEDDEDKDNNRGTKNKKEKPPTVKRRIDDMNRGR